MEELENKPISKQFILLPNGEYNALWSGYGMIILVPDKINQYVDTVVGVRGVNVKTKVRIKNGFLYLND